MIASRIQKLAKLAGWSAAVPSSEVTTTE